MSGGAGVEWLFGYAYPHDDISLEDFRSRDHLWELTKFAVDFFHQHLPFPEMEVSDELTASKDDYCLAKRGSVLRNLFFRTLRRPNWNWRPVSIRFAGTTRATAARFAPARSSESPVRARCRSVRLPRAIRIAIGYASSRASRNESTVPGSKCVAESDACSDQKAIDPKGGFLEDL
jgi:hypothetical protein